jgi:hypothetical protein
VATASLSETLLEHVQVVLARSRRIARRSSIVTHASRHAREPDGLLTHCAWCGRLRLGEDWVPLEEVPQFLLGGPADRRTHGICPECFDEAQRRAGDGAPRPATVVVIRTNGPLAVECLSRALSGYALVERTDFALEARLPDATGTSVGSLLSHVSCCLEENGLAPVTVELADRAYVLG